MRPGAPVVDQPHPAAVGSIVVVRPSVQPSWRPGRSAIRIVSSAKSADGIAARQSASAWTTTGSRTSGVRRAGSVPAGAAAAASIAPSLSTIVTVPVPVAIVAPPVGLDRTTVNVSVDSLTLSPTIATWNTRLVVPGLNVRVWVVAWKSEPALAVPATVLTTTVTVVVDARDSVTVTPTVLVLRSASVVV